MLTCSQCIRERVGYKTMETLKTLVVVIEGGESKG